MRLRSAFLSAAAFMASIASASLRAIRRASNRKSKRSRLCFIANTALLTALSSRFGSYAQSLKRCAYPARRSAAVEQVHSIILLPQTAHPRRISAASASAQASHKSCVPSRFSLQIGQNSPLTSERRTSSLFNSFIARRAFRVFCDQAPCIAQ